MKFIKNYGIIAVLMLLIILSAIIRNSGTDRFRVDAFRHAEPSIKGGKYYPSGENCRHRRHEASCKA